MWGINLKAANKQDRDSWTPDQWLPEGRGVRGGRWGKRGQLCGDRKKSNYGR